MPRLPLQLGLFVLLVSTRAFSADPVLPTYDWGSGVLTWKVDGRRVEGFLSGGECSIDGPVIDAAWQGDLLVGSVSLCQRGPGCLDKPFPLFAFYVHQDGRLVADVKLDPGCTSPALDDGRLVLTAHLSDSSASSHDSGKRERHSHNSAVSASGLSQHLGRGQAALAEGDGKSALAEFKAALDANEDVALSYQGWGMAEMLLKKPAWAVRAYRKSLAVRLDKTTYYDLACAQVQTNSPRDALDSLQRAIDLGFNDAAQMSHDSDLAPLHDDPEFKRILTSIWSRQSRRTR